MKGKRYTEEKIISILKEHESGDQRPGSGGSMHGNRVHRQSRHTSLYFKIEGGMLPSQFNYTCIETAIHN